MGRYSTSTALFSAAEITSHELLRANPWDPAGPMSLNCSHAHRRTHRVLLVHMSWCIRCAAAAVVCGRRLPEGSRLERLPEWLLVA